MNLIERADILDGYEYKCQVNAKKSLSEGCFLGNSKIPHNFLILLVYFWIQEGL